VNVRVLLFASLREAVGAGELALALPSGARASAVLAELQRRWPERRQLIERCALAVNEEYANPDLSLRDGDTVAVIPPVSGG
jgi:molybdopterin converting factor subunit 1